MASPAAIGCAYAFGSVIRLQNKQVRPPPTAGERSCLSLVATARFWPLGQRDTAAAAFHKVGSAAPRRAAPALAGWGRRTVAAAAGKTPASRSDLPEVKPEDVQRLMNLCQQLHDKVENMEAQLQQYEERSHDRAVALRAILRDDRQMDQLLSQTEDGQIALPEDEKLAWESYCNSFTLLISKGYLRTVEAMRSRLMASDGVARFEQYCADNKVPLSFEVISELYEDPTDLRGIEEPFLRMRARSTIIQAEAEERAKAWAACTSEAQRLAERFSEAEFISKVIPDPIETGVVDALRRLVTPLARGLSA
ncbi:hypothetical protein ABPG75_011661 [Micractinium tetrahymenae]